MNKELFLFISCHQQIFFENLFGKKVNIQKLMAIALLQKKYIYEYVPALSEVLHPYKDGSELVHLQPL